MSIRMMLRPWEFRVLPKTYITQIWSRYRLDDRVRNSAGIAQVLFDSRKSLWLISTKYYDTYSQSHHPVPTYADAEAAMQDCDKLLVSYNYSLMTAEQMAKIQFMI